MPRTLYAVYWLEAPNKGREWMQEADGGMVSAPLASATLYNTAAEAMTMLVGSEECVVEVEVDDEGKRTPGPIPAKVSVPPGTTFH